MWMPHLLTKGTRGILWLSSQACFSPGWSGGKAHHTIACHCFAKSDLVKSFLWSLMSLRCCRMGENTGSKRSCPWALTVLISKDTFKVVDNLSGTMMRCRVNQNLFDFFTGKVICMHASLVFLFLALGFIQLLIFFFIFFFFWLLQR